MIRVSPPASEPSASSARGSARKSRDVAQLGVGFQRESKTGGFIVATVADEGLADSAGVRCGMYVVGAGTENLTQT